PSPNGRRVGIRIDTFEACSGFTRVTARRIAQPPRGDLCHEAPALPVTQPSRSSASGPIDNFPGGTLLHLYERPGCKGPFGPPCARTTSHAAFSFPNSLVRPQADILPSRPAR